MARQNHRRWQRDPRVWVIALFLATAALEWSLARAGYGNPRAVVADERLGYRLAPGQRVVDENGIEERINAHGYRDDSWEGASKDALRIAVLGDSVAYGVGVPVEQRWCDLLEEEGVLVRCYAAPGWTLEQMIRAYEPDRQSFGADLVMLEIAPYSARPMRHLREPARYPLSGWIRKSALLDWLRRRVLARLDPQTREQEQRLIQSPDDPANEELYRTALARLEAFSEELGDTRLVIMETPLAEPIADPAWRAWAEDYIPLASGRIENEPGLFLSGDQRHLSAAGHRLIADKVRAWLEAEGFATPRASGVK